MRLKDVTTITSTLVGRYIGHTGTVVQVIWSPDSARLASISWDETAIIWQIAQP